MALQGFNERKFIRLDADVDAYITAKELDSKLKVETKNIGQGGICAISDKKTGLFEKVSIQIDLETGVESIFCDAAVVWEIKTFEYGKEKYDIGLEFIDLKDKDTVLIEKFIEETLAKQSEEI